MVWRIDGWHRQASPLLLCEASLRCVARGAWGWSLVLNFEYITVKTSTGNFRKTCQRVSKPGDAHELTFSCYRNQPFLKAERTCRYLVDAIEKVRRKHNFSLWAYVFIPNHVHLLICPNQQQYSISAILASIKQSTARRALNYLRKENLAGLKQLATGQPDSPYRFWQDGGGYDRNINHPDTLLKTIRYIHANPIRKGLVELTEDWYYSSAGEWQKPGSGPMRIDFDTWPIP